MSTENHQEWAEQRRREQARVSVCKLEGTGCLFQEFSEIASFCMLRKNESRTTRPSRRSHPPQLSGDSLARKSHPPIILELSASRALLETVQGSAVLLALNPSSNPWHTLRTRWYLFGSTFFSRKTTWNPCINTLLLAKDTALFCIPLQTRKWPLHFKRSIHELVHEENTHAHEETYCSLFWVTGFPCTRHYLNIHSAAGHGTTSPEPILTSDNLHNISLFSFLSPQRQQ